MTAVSADILLKGRELAQSLRREGRVEDALVIDTLVCAVDPAPLYFTTGDVARRLGVSRQTIVNWIRQGYMPGERVGGRMMVPASAAFDAARGCRGRGAGKGALDMGGRRGVMDD